MRYSRHVSFYVLIFEIDKYMKEFIWRSKNKLNKRKISCLALESMEYNICVGLTILNFYSLFIVKI